MSYYFSITRQADEYLLAQVREKKPSPVRMAVLRGLLVPYSIEDDTFGGNEYLLTRDQLGTLLGEYTSILGALLSYREHPEISDYPKRAPARFKTDWPALATLSPEKDGGISGALRQAYQDPEGYQYRLLLTDQ